MDDIPEADRVWIEHRGRWYPGVLETWNRRDSVLRYWIRYAVPVNGWDGGWYESVLSDDGEDPNQEGLGWMARVEAASAGE